MKHKVGTVIERLGLMLTFYAWGCWAPSWFRDTSWVIAGLTLGCVLVVVGGVMTVKPAA